MLYDAEGERLQTIRYARMSEPKKTTLGQQVQAEAQSVLAVRPDLIRVHLSDGAEANWQLLAQWEVGEIGPPPPTIDIVDFFHTCEHVKRACDAVWGESPPQGQAQFQRLKTLLKEAEDGVEQVIRALTYRRGRARGRKRERIETELTSFRNQRERMPYAAYVRDHLPMASGVMEAACKTLVTQRLKRSGMAWTQAGGQAILALRSLIQSERWNKAWALLRVDFCQSVNGVDAMDDTALPRAAGA